MSADERAQARQRDAVAKRERRAAMSADARAQARQHKVAAERERFAPVPFVRGGVFSCRITR